MHVHELITVQGQVSRVKYAETPTVELKLEDNETILSFDLRPLPARFDSARMTQDWMWKAVIQRRGRPTR